MMDHWVKNKRQMELILNSTGDGILGVDYHGLITFINPAGSSLLGYASDELIGMDAYQVLKHGDEDGIPYSRENCPIFQRVMLFQYLFCHLVIKYCVID